MKRFVSLMVILCLLSCTALAADGDLPDVEAFSGGLLEIDSEKTKELDFATLKKYTGTDEDVLFVASEYITLLTEKYSLDEICHFSSPGDNYTCMNWAFKYTKSAPKMSAMDLADGNFDWRINDYHVYIQYSQSDYYEDGFFKIWYCNEFNYADTGDRIDLSTQSTAVPTVKPTEQPTAVPTAKLTAKPTTKPTAKPTSKPTAAPTVTAQKCPECNGTGKCQTCGGDMWVWRYKWVYVNGSPESVMKNELCDAVYCTGGSCSKCGGDGVLD